MNTRKHRAALALALGIAVPAIGATGVAQAATPPAAVESGTGAATQTDPYAAFYDAGYTYDDAVELAAIWDRGNDLGGVKADAATAVENGQALPVEPSGTPGGLPNVTVEEAVDEFLGAGYRYTDAVAIAEAWNLGPDADLQYVKGLAGEKLMAGTPLPVEPSAEPVPSDEDHVATFFDAGYDYADAVELADLWNSETPYDAKVLAGQKLDAGYELPIEP